MVEVRHVEIVGPSQPHIDCTARLVKDDLGHHLQSVGQLTRVGHLLVSSFLLLPEDLGQVVVMQLLHELLQRQPMV